MYNILCDSLGIDPLPNNGTLRLPLNPVGLHSDENTPPPEHPPDPPQQDSNTGVKPEPTSPAAGTPPEPDAPAEPDTPPEADSGNDDNKKASTWLGAIWNWVGDTASSVKNFVGGLVPSLAKKH